MVDEVDILIRNVDVLTLDDRKPVLLDSDTAIKSGRIAAIGRDLAHVDSKQEQDGKQKVAMLGLVDAHTHGFQMFLREVLPSEELNVHSLWLKVLIPFEAEMNPEEPPTTRRRNIQTLPRNNTSLLMMKTAQGVSENLNIW